MRRAWRSDSSGSRASAALTGLLAGGLICAGACAPPSGTSEDGSASETGSEGAEGLLNLPDAFPGPQIPEDNPLSAAKVELGRHLFYDPRLSGNETQSCGSCHEQALAFADGKATATGSTGEQLSRNSLGLSNSAYSLTLTWANPVLEALEQQIRVPMFGEFPVELGITGHEQEVLARFVADPLYQGMFAEAFPDEAEPITFDNIVKSLASFIRTMISGQAPFDAWAAGDEQAVSESAKRGVDLFFSERLECHHCHGGFNFSLATKHENTSFTQSAFMNTGLYNLDGEGAYPVGNRGLYEFSFEDFDMGRFRPPSLRNVALTAPYMHDGSVESLEEVLEIYAAGGRVIEQGELAGDGTLNPHKSGFVSGFELSDQDKADMLAFLESLTDENFVTDPRFADPWP